MKTRILIAALAACGLACGAASADDAKLVFLGGARPMLIKLKVENNGLELMTAWDECVSKIFKHLDVNEDGSLSKDEASRMPPANVLFGSGDPFQQRLLAVPRNPGAPQTDIDADKNGKVTREELAEHLLRNGGEPLRMEFGAPQSLGSRIVIVNGALAGGNAVSADAINTALFTLLDADKDGKLSREELADAPQVLKKLDTDDDEMVSLNELVPGGNQAGVRFFDLQATAAVVTRTAAAPGVPANSPFFLVVSKQSAVTLGERLLQRYGGPNARSVTRKQAGLDEKTFGALDTDRDDALDAKELAGVADLSADVEMVVRIGKKKDKDPAVELIGDGKRAEAVGAKVSIKDGLVILELGVNRLELRLGGDQPQAGTRIVQVPDFELMQFKAADADNNGYLDEKEAMGNPAFRNAFKVMDRDGDGMLLEKEVKAYLTAIKDMQATAKAGTAVLNVSDQGRGLFDLIDTRRDGNLGMRELREAGALLAQLDRDADAKLDRAEVPKNFQLRFNPGGGTGTGQVFAVAAVGGVAGAPAPPPQPMVGPMWFRKMDRNRDGDLSRREFLGTDAEFQRLDADHDGLIDSKEADKAEDALRK